MKITSIEAISLSRPHERDQQWFTSKYRTIKADASIVVITTDDGVQGIGEACAYGVPTLIDEVVKWLEPEFVGQDPRDLTLPPHPNGRARQYDCAAAGIDSALWDLRGKFEGKTVRNLISDDAVNRVRLYASSGCRYDWRDRPEQLIEEVVGYADDGYTACKVRIGTEWSWDGVTVDRFLGLMRDLAQTIDGRLELMLDGNQRLSEDQALVIARELERLGFAWFEEPIPQTDVDGYSRLNAAVDIPITGGEQFTTVEQFRPYLEKQAYAIVQPDVGLCGITEAIKIAHIADRYGVKMRPHSWHNGLMALGNANVIATLPYAPLLELCMIQGPLQWDILATKPNICQGYLELPDAPGLGVTLAEGIEDRFPYIEGHYAIQVER
jgi:L-alanine-DL-glutamate epimerase-like enolase superfamily enzyme